MDLLLVVCLMVSGQSGQLWKQDLRLVSGYHLEVTKHCIVICNSASLPKCPIKALFVAKNCVGDCNITMVRYVAHFSEHASLCEVKYRWWLNRNKYSSSLNGVWSMVIWSNMWSCVKYLQCDQILRRDLCCLSRIIPGRIARVAKGFSGNYKVFLVRQIMQRMIEIYTCSSKVLKRNETPSIQRPVNNSGPKIPI